MYVQRMPCATELYCEAKEEKEIGTVALVRVLNKGRLDSLGADLRIEKEIRTFALEF